MVEGILHSLLAAPPQGNGFGPTRTDIGTGQRVQELSFSGIPTVGYQVNFHETGLIFVPIRKSAYRDGLLEQGAGFGGRETMGGPESDRVQAAVYGGAAHSQKQMLYFWR